MFGDIYYRETTFGCETCGFALYQQLPSTLVTCLNPTCTAEEPLFLVEASDD